MALIGTRACLPAPPPLHKVCLIPLRCAALLQVALVDSGVRMREEDRTAYIFLPGGLGTMDEL